jgi:lipopolysaccharide biosynthesis glycosyltransferase
VLVPLSFSQENRQNIIDSLQPWNPKVDFVYVDNHDLPELKVGGHVSTATYHRLYVPELLPSYVKSALYLDADIIINQNISELLSMEVSDYSLAAVPDSVVDKDEIIRSKINLPMKAHYFNGGVLLLNLERCRSEGICVRALEFCRVNPESITYWDQCAINHTVRGNFCVLDKKWNFQRHHIVRLSTNEFSSDAMIEASCAAIMHFTGPDKPWLPLCTHPMKHLYFGHLRHTKWHDFAERD